MANYCPNCGQPVDGSAAYCSSCGAALNGGASANYSQSNATYTQQSTGSTVSSILGTLVTVSLIGGLTRQLYYYGGRYFMDPYCMHPFDSPHLIIGRRPMPGPMHHGPMGGPRPMGGGPRPMGGPGGMGGGPRGGGMGGGPGGHGGMGGGGPRR